MNKQEINLFIAQSLFGILSQSPQHDYIKDYRPVLEWLCLAEDIIEVRVGKGKDKKWACSLLYLIDESNFDAVAIKGYEKTADSIGKAVCLVAIWYYKKFISQFD